AFEPRLLHPLRDCLGREAEPAMGILFAQELKLMRAKVDDQEPALRPQHPGRLADGAAAVIKKVQHLMDDDHIKGVARHGKIEDVALPDAAIADTGVVEPAAGDGQHLAAEIDPETTLDLGAEQFKNAAGPGAEIEQGTKRAVQQQRTDFRLDGIVAGVKPADA